MSLQHLVLHLHDSLEIHSFTNHSLFPCLNRSEQMNGCLAGCVWSSCWRDWQEFSREGVKSGTQAKYAYRKMLMLTSRRALTQQNLDQNTLSRRLRTLGPGVSSDCCTAEIHNPVPRPHVTRRDGWEPAEREREQTQEVPPTITPTCLSHDVWFYSKCCMFTRLPWELRCLIEDTFCRGISLCGSSDRVHQVRLHTWDSRKVFPD